MANRLTAYGADLPTSSGNLSDMAPTPDSGEVIPHGYSTTPDSFGGSASYGAGGMVIENGEDGAHVTLPPTTKEPPEVSVAASRSVHSLYESSEGGPRKVLGVARLRSLLSVRTAISFLCLLSILASTLSTSLLYTELYQAGLDDSRESCDNGFRTLSNASTTSLNGVSRYLMYYSSLGTEQSVVSYVDRGFAIAYMMEALITDVYAALPKNRTFVDAVALHLYREVRGVQKQIDHGLDNPVRTITIFSGNLAISYNMAPGGPVYALEQREEDPYPFISFPNSETHRIDRQTAFPYRLSVSALTSLVMARENMLPMGAVRLSNIEVIGEHLTYPIALRLPDAHNASHQVEAAVYVSLQGLSQFLVGLSEKSQVANPKSRSRLYTAIKYSWVSQAFKDAGHADWEKYDQSGVLTGASHGLATNVTRGWDPATNQNRTMHSELQAVDSTDPLIRGIAEYLADTGHEAAAAAGITVSAIMVNGTQENHFVGVRNIHLPERGLDWWMVSSIDEDSILGDVQRNISALSEQFDQNRADVQSRITDKERRSTYIIVAIGVSILVFGVFIAAAILRPIEKLQKAMSRVARMELDHLNIAVTSPMYEPRQMQQAFCSMVDSLVEYRAYVPSSLLTNEAVRIDPPTGNVAIMFTDIQGSTQLWKRSAEDMNTALELHNDVIRECCVEHGGYEVKTIGDSFMVSFQDPVPAVKCALDIQGKFKDQNWPSEDLSLPPGGLVIRIGVNYGSTIAEENPVTGRVDYRGSTVNMASRLEGKALGGTVCISSDLYAVVRASLKDIGSPQTLNIGTHELRGLGSGHTLYLVVQQALAHRLRRETSDCNAIVTKGESGGNGNSSGKSSTPSNAEARRNDAKLKSRGTKTALKIARGLVTTAVCRVLASENNDSQDFDNCNVMVKASCDTAQSCGGVVVGLSGYTLTVLWNASKRCSGHTLAGLNFAAQLRQRASKAMRIGIASGSVLHGNVGTQKHRFSTVFGVTLDVASSVADLAHTLGSFCLFADCTPTGRALDSSVQGCCRLIDMWYATEEKQKIQVLQVDEKMLLQKIGVWEEDSTEGLARSREQATHIQRFCAKPGTIDAQESLSALAALATKYNDSLLRVIVELLAASQPVVGCRCAVTFSKVPAAAASELLIGAASS